MILYYAMDEINEYLEYIENISWISTVSYRMSRCIIYAKFIFARLRYGAKVHMVPLMRSVVRIFKYVNDTKSFNDHSVDHTLDIYYYLNKLSDLLVHYREPVGQI
jgi:hypothetical protein